MRVFLVRKHRAPNGALRLDVLDTQGELASARQKAPSAIRRIKTELDERSLCLVLRLSEITEYQKVH